MGVLSDGTPYLNQRGLAATCGVTRQQISSLSAQWSEPIEKPRIKAIKSILEKSGSSFPHAHIEISLKGSINFCYPSDVCLAVIEYYAFDAGSSCTEEARDNFRALAGSKLKELIYSQLGYDPSSKNSGKFEKWHERIQLNYQAAPKGYFHVFNEAHTIFYELIRAGAPIGDKMIVDISIGQHWSTYWAENDFDNVFSVRDKFSHNYPDSHPQAKSNPQKSWCYPLLALGCFREWLQDSYIAGGKFKTYINRKVSNGDLPPSVAQLAIKTLVPEQIA